MSGPAVAHAPSPWVALDRAGRRLPPPWTLVSQSWVVAGPGGVVVCACDARNGGALAEKAANAHLVAAAPDLYRVLARFVDALGDELAQHDVAPALVREACRVLAQARGGGA